MMQTNNTFQSKSIKKSNNQNESRFKTENKNLK